MDNTIGRRIRALRYARRIDASATRSSRGHLSRMENGQMLPSLEMAEQLCSSFEVGFSRFFGPDEQFEVMLMLEDEFVLAVKPYLKQLTEEQRQQVLKVLDAAPKQRHSERQSFASFENRI